MKDNPSGRRRWIYWALVGSALPTFAAYWLFTSYGGIAVSNSFEYPTPHAVEILACDGQGAWLSIMDGMPELSGHANPRVLLASRRVNWIPRTGNPWEVSIGPSISRTLFVAADDSSWMVVQEPTDNLDYAGRSRLLYLGKGKTAWEDRSTPGPLIGAAFETGLEGLAWSLDAVFGTLDGGQTWTSVSLAPWRIAGHQMPKLIPAEMGGGLLVPLETPPLSDGSSRLVRVGMDMRIQVIAHWDHTSITGVALAKDQIVVASKPWLNGPSKITVASLGDHQFRFQEVWTSEKEIVEGLQANRLDVYFVSAGEWGKAGFFGATPQALLKASDGNWNWSRTNITRQRVESICIAPGGIWTLGGWNRHLAYSRNE